MNLRKLSAGKPITYFSLAVYAFLSIYPLFWMLFYSLKTKEEIFVTNPFGIPWEFRFDNYERAINQFNIMAYFMNSVIVTVSSIAIELIIALMFSYAVTRLDWKLSRPMKTFIVLSMFIPMQVTMIPLVMLLKDLKLLNSLFSLILPYSAGLAFPVLIFSSFFSSIPEEIEESALMEGSSVYTTFLSIMVPLVKPAIATAVIFKFLSVWNEFSLALIIISNKALRTLPLGLVFFSGEQSTDWGAKGAALVIASIPTVIIYLIFRRKVESALTVGSAIK